MKFRFLLLSCLLAFPLFCLSQTTQYARLNVSLDITDTSPGLALTNFSQGQFDTTITVLKGSTFRTGKYSVVIRGIAGDMCPSEMLGGQSDFDFQCGPTRDWVYFRQTPSGIDMLAHAVVADGIQVDPEDGTKMGPVWFMQNLVFDTDISIAELTDVDAVCRLFSEPVVSARLRAYAGGRYYRNMVVGNINQRNSCETAPSGYFPAQDRGLYAIHWDDIPARIQREAGSIANITVKNLDDDRLVIVEPAQNRLL